MFRKNHEILSRPSSFALFIGTHSAGICLAQSGSVPQALLKCTLIVPLPNLMVVLTDVSTRSPWAEKTRVYWTTQSWKFTCLFCFRISPLCLGLNIFLGASESKESHFFSYLILCILRMTGRGR